LKQGNKELAVWNYRKSLQLNPDNETAIKLLESLKDAATVNSPRTNSQ